MKKTGKFGSLILNTASDNRGILIRLAVGLIFLTEGIQKFLFPDLLGPGRFMKIGFTYPAFWAYFTGTFEIICGLLVLLGCMIRLASIPLLNHYDNCLYNNKMAVINVLKDSGHLLTNTVPILP